MITTKFEDMYSCVNDAKASIEELAEIVDFLRAQTAPLTCREIGLAIFGNDYVQGDHKRSLSGRLGQMLKHLCQNGYVKIAKVNGEPIEVEREEYVRDADNNGNRPFIKVHDDEGNTYDMPNPKYDRWACNKGTWQMVKKTVTPTYKVYSWVAE